MPPDFPVPNIASHHYDDYLAKMPSMVDQTIAITGATTGLGFVAAKALLQKGAHVIVLNRPSQRATAALEALNKACLRGARVTQIDCDLLEFASVRAAATAVLKEGKVDVLVNNAGGLSIVQEVTKTSPLNYLRHYLNVEAYYFLVVSAKPVDASPPYALCLLTNPYAVKTQQTPTSLFRSVQDEWHDSSSALYASSIFPPTAIREAATPPNRTLFSGFRRMSTPRNVQYRSISKGRPSNASRELSLVPL
jgi:NAD(P)-dependent dehydrogenase (short-subunit alcohol dehydrogenase family)